ncbi:hypothetical protein ABFS82_03G032700 [Erythranthe guttata]
MPDFFSFPFIFNQLEPFRLVNTIFFCFSFLSSLILLTRALCSFFHPKRGSPFRESFLINLLLRMGSPPSPKFHTDNNFKKILCFYHRKASVRFFKSPLELLLFAGAIRFQTITDSGRSISPRPQNCRRPSVFSTAANASGQISDAKSSPPAHKIAVAHRYFLLPSTRLDSAHLLLPDSWPLFICSVPLFRSQKRQNTC